MFFLTQRTSGKEEGKLWGRRFGAHSRERSKQPRRPPQSVKAGLWREAGVLSTGACQARWAASGTPGSTFITYEPGD